MLKPLHDFALVEMEEQAELYDNSSIVRVGDNPVRIAKVLAVGPGRTYQDRFVPTVLAVGDRVAFFVASTECGSGPSISYRLGDRQRLIRETDVLVVVDGAVSVAV
jgi:co-chaperonin GroES (HSP10)